jgi:hypothetical protein
VAVYRCRVVDDEILVDLTATPDTAPPQES